MEEKILFGGASEENGSGGTAQETEERVETVGEENVDKECDGNTGNGGNECCDDGENQIPCDNGDNGDGASDNDGGCEATAEDVPARCANDKASTQKAADSETFGATADAEIRSALAKIRDGISEAAEADRKIFGELYELHRLYHSEFAGRLRSMQEELDVYRKAERGRAFDDILGAIARIYCNNESLESEIDDPKAKKHVRYLLLDILELLEQYGVMMMKSNVGDKRNPRHCQVLERIPTDNPELHGTVARSHSCGFYIENRTVIKEMIDMYAYSGNTDPDTGSEDTVTADGDTKGTANDTASGCEDQ